MTMYNRAPMPPRPITGYESVIGAGMQIAGGELRGGDTRIDGIVRAPVTVSGALMVSQNAEVHGDIVADEVIVSGSVYGEITADTVDIQPNGQVFGNIITQDLRTASGAYIDGKLIMDARPNGDDGPPSSPPPSDPPVVPDPNSDKPPGY